MRSSIPVELIYRAAEFVVMAEASVGDDMDRRTFEALANLNSWMKTHDLSSGMPWWMG
jgi:hypothetical protein